MFLPNVIKKLPVKVRIGYILIYIIGNMYHVKYIILLHIKTSEGKVEVILPIKVFWGERYVCLFLIKVNELGVYIIFCYLNKADHVVAHTYSRDLGPLAK